MCAMKALEILKISYNYLYELFFCFCMTTCSTYWCFWCTTNYVSYWRWFFLINYATYWHWCFCTITQTTNWCYFRADTYTTYWRWCCIHLCYSLILLILQYHLWDLLILLLHNHLCELLMTIKLWNYLLNIFLLMWLKKHLATYWWFCCMPTCTTYWSEKEEGWCYFCESCRKNCYH